MPDIYRHLAVKEWTQQAQPWTPANDVEVDQNWDVIEEFLDDLEFHEAPGSDQRTNEQRNAVAERVSLEKIFEKLLLPMCFSRFDAPNFSAVELAIQWYIRRMRRNRDATAVVYRMSAERQPLVGGGRRRRGIRNNFRVVNLFQGAAPVNPVSLRGSVYPGDRRVHATDELTVQIHDLDLTEPVRPYKLLRGHVPAIAVWMPNFMRVGVFEEMADLTAPQP